jgi:hypothetical protein
MCFGRIILPIETNESTVFLLNFNFNTGAIQVYNHRQPNVMVACLRAGEALYSCIISYIIYIGYNQRDIIRVGRLLRMHKAK